MFLLHAAVEKVGDVGILLGFRQTIVAHADLFPNFRQNVFVIVRSKSDRKRKRSVVNSEANKIESADGRSRQTLKAGNRQRPGELSRAIGPKVEKDDRIAVLDCCHRLTVGVDDHSRFNKLVRDSSFVGTLESPQPDR